MAEWFFKDLCIKRKTLYKINIQSAGIGAIDGMPASENTLSILKKHGIDASSHRSQKLTSSHIKWADIVIAMTQSHLDDIKKISYSFDRKPEMKLLSEYSLNRISISDPFGGEASLYEECFSEMKKYLYAFYDIIEKEL